MLGKQIKLLREAQQISQVQLAESLHVSKQSVSNWENGNILPSIEMLMKLAQHFSVSTDYLLGLEERRFLEITGLTPQEVAHLQFLIQDLKARSQSSESAKQLRSR